MLYAQVFKFYFSLQLIFSYSILFILITKADKVICSQHLVTGVITLYKIPTDLYIFLQKDPGLFLIFDTSNNTATNFLIHFSLFRFLGPTLDN